MKTLYKVEIEKVDEDGRYRKFYEFSEWISLEDAKKIGFSIKKDDSYLHTGNWQIIARTIDEETFTVEEKVIGPFGNDYDIEIPNRYKQWIAEYSKEIEELEFTQPSSQKREQRLFWLKTRINYYENELRKHEKDLDFLK